jgi:hypothetical protein
MIKNLLSIFSAALFSIAASAPQHSKVEFSYVTAADGSSKLGFRVVPNAGLKITPDAPWKLQIKSAEGIELGATEFDRTKFSEKVPGFEVPVSKINAPSGKLSFKLISFVCTENKTQCYREVHEQTSEWKK